MKGNRNICQHSDCINYQKYCRIHIGYSIPVVKEVNKVSDNQKEILKEYKKIRGIYLKEHPVCMAKLEGCKGKATEIHHKLGKHSKEDYLNQKYFLAVCRQCHLTIEANPSFSKQNGFSISRLSKKRA